MRAFNRLQVEDVMNRLAMGLDHDDPGVLASAFTEDAIADFSPAAAKVGLEFPVVTGRDAIVGACRAIGALETSHSVTNIQVMIDGNDATLQAQVMAQHFRLGDGSAPGRTRHCLLLERFGGTLTRERDTWRLRRLTIDNVWTDGDATIIGEAFARLA